MRFVKAGVVFTMCMDGSRPCQYTKNRSKPPFVNHNMDERKLMFRIKEGSEFALTGFESVTRAGYTYLTTSPVAHRPLRTEGGARR